MKRIAGFAYVEIAVALVALALFTAAVMSVRSYLKDVDRQAYERGVAETSDAWRRRAAIEEAEYAKEYQALRDEMDASLTSLNQQLYDAQTAFENERKDHEANKLENARIERDLRAARLVLRDPGKARSPAAGEACRGQGPAGAETKPGSDAAARDPAQLSPELAGFLWSEASRADEVVEDLEARLVLAQDTVRAYYLLAERCHAAE